MIEVTSAYGDHERAKLPKEVWNVKMQKQRGIYFNQENLDDKFMEDRNKVHLGNSECFFFSLAFLST